MYDLGFVHPSVRDQLNTMGAGTRELELVMYPKSWTIRHSNGEQSDRRWSSGWPELSRFPRIAVIGVESIAFVVLDAPQRGGVRLVQNHA